MNLAGAKLYQPNKNFPVLTGWINAVDTNACEARGHFTLPTQLTLNLTDGALTLVADGVKLRLLSLQARPSELDGCSRWRFVARCNPHQVNLRMQPNPSPNDSLEIQLMPDLKESLEDTAVKFVQLRLGDKI